MDAQERPPAVAGLFYPADPGSLAATVDGLLDAAAPTGPHATRIGPPGQPGRHGHAGEPERAGRSGPAGGPERPRALVVPHAAYRYSGPVAAAAYARLRPAAPGRVVLVGPAHYVPLSGCAVPRAAAWRTPLGLVPVDATAREAALRLPGVRADDAPHAPEHSLEVQLPFLQRCQRGAGELRVLPVVARAPAGAVADLLDAVAADPGTLVLASTDLTHHLPEAAAREHDARTADAVLDLRPDGIADRSACGAHALRGLLAWAARHSLRASRLALATSADTGGDPGSVVGYAAFAFG